MNTSPTILIALGNLLMSDEGVGVRVLEALRAEGAPGVDFLDSGNSGMRVLHSLEGRRKAVFVDCAFMGTEPGTIKRFTTRDVESRKALPGLSLHEGDLVRTLELAERLGTLPAETVILGIEPASVEPGPDLTPILKARFEGYLEAVRAELVSGRGK